MVFFSVSPSNKHLDADGQPETRCWREWIHREESQSGPSDRSEFSVLRCLAPSVIHCQSK